MTIEERAKELARAIVYGNGLVSPAVEAAKQSITAAVEEARADEREACAKICEEEGDDGEWRIGVFADGLAEQIRARGKEKK